MERKEDTSWVPRVCLLTGLLPMLSLTSLRNSSCPEALSNWFSCSWHAMTPSTATRPHSHQAAVVLANMLSPSGSRNAYRGSNAAEKIEFLALPRSWQPLLWTQGAEMPTVDRQWAIRLYTGFQNKLCHFFCNIFGVFWLILTQHSPLQSEMIRAHLWNRIFHITLITLANYLTKNVQ